MITVRLTTSGTPIGEQVHATEGVLAAAVTAAVAAAATGAKAELRKQLTGSGYNFGRAANAIRSDAYPKPPARSLKAVGVVRAAGESAERYLTAFSAGAVIVPKHGKCLAIPLTGAHGNYRQRLGPASSFFSGPNALVFIPTKHLGGTTVGILAMKREGSGRGRSRLQRGVARGLRNSDLTPYFILVSTVKLRKILSPEDVMVEWANRIPELAQQAADILQGS